MNRLATAAICALMGTTTAFAQLKGEKAVGVQMNFGTETSVGIGTRFQYHFSKDFRVEPEFDYFFKHDGVKTWDLGLNAHYLFHLQNVNVYPLLGVGYAHHTLAGTGLNDGSFQGKIGAGAEMKIATQWKVYAEPKFQFMEDANQFLFTVGIAYCFF